MGEVNKYYKAVLLITIQYIMKKFYYKYYVNIGINTFDDDLLPHVETIDGITIVPFALNSLDNIKKFKNHIFSKVKDKTSCFLASFQLLKTYYSCENCNNQSIYFDNQDDKSWCKDHFPGISATYYKANYEN